MTKILWAVPFGQLIAIRAEDRGETYRIIETLMGEYSHRDISADYNRYGWFDTLTEAIEDQIRDDNRLIARVQAEITMLQDMLARADEIVAEAEGKVTT